MMGYTRAPMWGKLLVGYNVGSEVGFPVGKRVSEAKGALGGAEVGQLLWGLLSRRRPIEVSLISYVLILPTYVENIPISLEVRR